MLTPTPNLKTAALIIIDMQADFLDVDGPFVKRFLHMDDAQRSALIDANRRSAEVMRNAGRPVIFIRVEHCSNLKDNALSPIHVRAGLLDDRLCIEGTEGTQIVAGLDVLPEDYTVIKKGHGSFLFTNLDRLLVTLGVRDCIYSGGGVSGCISDTVYQGSALGYRQWLIEDALYPPNDEPHLEVLADLAPRITSSELVTLAGQPMLPGDGTASDGAATAVLLLGLQNDFLDPNGDCPTIAPPDADRLSASLTTYLDHARAQGWLVIHAPFVQRRDQLDSAAPPGWPTAGPLVCVEGSWGARLVDDFPVMDRDVVIRRCGPNAFAFTPLLRILRNRGITDLIIVGGDIRQAVSGTIRDAAAHGFRVSIVKDLTFPRKDQYLDLLGNRADII